MSIRTPGLLLRILVVSALVATTGSGALWTPPPDLPGGDVRVNGDTTALNQAEPTIGVEPDDTSHLVAAWIDQNRPPGQRRNLGYAASFDGGATWSGSTVSFGSFPPGYALVDPSVVLDSDGNAYLGFLGVGTDRADTWVSKSTDGGLTFPDPVLVRGGETDKPYLALDPATEDLHIVWREVGSGLSSGIISHSRSVDGGATWSPEVQVGQGDGSIAAPFPAIGPAGQVYVIWKTLNGDGTWTFWLDRSLDGGATWLATDKVVEGAGIDTTGFLEGSLRNPVLPSLAVDRSGGGFDGRVYVAYTDGRFGDPDILLRWSSDQGDTWSSPVRVNDDAVGNGADQILPWAVVDDSGAVHILFYDRRDDPDGFQLTFFLATSTDGGQSFGPNVRVASWTSPDVELDFPGDYVGGTVAGNRFHPIWVDRRDLDWDTFTRGISLSDYDGDGVPNDGDGNGRYADSPCTGGQTADCDDNCPGLDNPSQADGDGDGVGDACDNCVSTINQDQADLDRDGTGDACDPCQTRAGYDGTDTDGDGWIACEDNCPAQFNDDQADSDGDDIGDLCDPCPGDDVNDPDGDGHCASGDNCPTVRNPLQIDGDGDGDGNLCDNCPETSNGDQADTDGDGYGDACDCDVPDPGDRAPEPPRESRIFRTEDGHHFSWFEDDAVDTYLVRRGLLSSLGSGSYGACYLRSVDAAGFEDTETPPAGDGYFYLIRGQNFDCGVGTLGFASGELERSAGADACSPVTFTDTVVSSEQTVIGTRIGDFTATQVSDDGYEQIREAASGGFNKLDHRWTFQSVPTGSRVELHSELYRQPGAGTDNFRLEFSTDGGSNFTEIVRIGFPFADDDRDVRGVFPAGVSGTVIVRLVDFRFETASPISRDTILVDHLFIRSVE